MKSELEFSSQTRSHLYSIGFDIIEGEYLNINAGLESDGRLD